MGLSAPIQKQHTGRIHRLELQSQPAEKGGMALRYKLHNILTGGMIIVGAAAAAYGLLIHPLIRHMH